MADEPTDLCRSAAGVTTALSPPAAVDRATFQAELDRLRVREKAHTHEGDAIAAVRRRLPMVEVDASTPLKEQVVQFELVEAAVPPSLELGLDRCADPRHRGLAQRRLAAQRVGQRGLHVTYRQPADEPGDH